MDTAFPPTSYRLSFYLLLAALCGGCASANPDLPPPGATVEMHFHSFEPQSVTIHAGQSVLWRNTTPIVWHTVTCDPAKAELPKDVALPPGVAPFDSGNVTSGTVYQHIFTEPGTYKYFCEPHESKGMTGEVIVLPAAAAPPAAAPPAPAAPSPAPAAPRY